jgi:guanylate kinase
LGKAVIICAPSGSGKTTIVKCLLQNEQRLSFSISATSRKIRSGERDGRDYYFIPEAGFRGKIEAGEFIEWEEVYPGVLYGTLKSEVERIWKDGKNVIFDVDVQGGINLKKYFGNDSLSIFIKVRDMETLEKRLRLRKTETESDINMRLKKSAYEMTFENRFDYIIINDSLEQSCREAINKVEEFLNQ